MTKPMKMQESILIAGKPFASMTIMLLGVYGSIWMKKSLNLSEAIFFGLVAVSVLYSIFLPYSNQIASFSIAKGELNMREIKQTESAVKDVGKAVAELIEVNDRGTMRSGEFDQTKYEYALQRLKDVTGR